VSNSTTEVDESLLKKIIDAMATYSGEEIDEVEALTILEAFEANGLEILEIDEED
jgi:hypothetical protein